MAIAKLSVGDTVKVIAGQSRGKVGTVIKILGDKVYVKGINLLKKAVKINRSEARQEDAQGKFNYIEGAIHISNVSLFSKEDNKLIKVSVNNVDGKKVRVNRKTGAVILTKEVQE